MVEFVLRLHHDLEEAYVMRRGVHDMGLVESAVSSPFQTFAGEDLYPTVYDKAAQICYALAKDHGCHPSHELEKQFPTIVASKRTLKHDSADLIGNLC